jgi:hypothetical protein
MVRLRLSRRRRDRCDLSRFQFPFHNGSIETLFFTSYYIKQEISSQIFFILVSFSIIFFSLFSLSVSQSTLILLNPGFWLQASVPYYNFHSTMVRLRLETRKKPDTPTPRPPYFLSTMVRLRRWTLCSPRAAP